MALETKTVPTDLIMQAIQKAITEEAGLLYDAEVAKLTEHFVQRKDQIVTGIVLNVMNYVSMESFAGKTIITIRKDETIV